MDESTHERITRLEESLAFSDRTVEELHAEVLSLSRRVEALTARLARAESALAERPAQGSGSGETGGGAGGGDEPLEVPPHSHMPLDRDAGRTTDPFFRPEGPRGPEPPARA